VNYGGLKGAQSEVKSCIKNQAKCSHAVLFSLNLILVLIDSRWREIGERSKIEAKMFEKAEFTWGK